MRHPPTIATHLASHASSPCAHRSGLCHGRYVIKPDGKRADCWHAGGTNHGCFLRFDLGGTPRITHVKTAVLQASAFLRTMALLERRVFEPETGRTRLVKANGEIVEEIVSREAQLAIRRRASTTIAKAIGCGATAASRLR
mgnify:CR=1 FL=1